MKNQADKIIRWGIIGCGDVTEIKSGPPYYKIEGFTLQAVMRRNKHKAKDYATRHNVPTYYSNADDLINDKNIDAIYIATPPDTHKYYGLKVASAGKPCCIEKPLSPNYKDSLAIVTAFKNANQPLFVAYYRRTLPRFLQIKNWLDSGKIGTVKHINWQLNKPASKLDLSKKENFRTDAEIAPGGYFDDLASHGLDLFTYFLGNIKEAKGIAINQQNLYSAKDAIAACWIHDNNITGSGNWNFGTFAKVDKVEIYGENGTIEFAIFDDSPILLKTETAQISLSINHPENVQYFHVKAIKEHLFSKIEHPSTGENGLHTSWVMDKILGVI